MKPNPESILFRKFKEDDSAAFNELFVSYYQPLFLFACKFVEEDIAKDLLQDCFFELWKNRKTIDIKTSLSAYLFSIVRNRCYKYFEKERLKNGKLTEIEIKLKQEELNYFQHSEKSVLEFEIRDRIQKTIQKLPPKCAQIFNESRFNGLSNKEIAEKYELSVKSVEKHISKALKIFQEEFKDHSYIYFLLKFENI
ncbi:RNA polymerase sigma-70 factor [Draconibacterium sp. IB214405]|uniref:RNA polymerase sigma-70 factor n=1 Tax=Draconibacterium sp. IB214405 TaxID=3097352 RepID=UPI002A0DE145|nr:RNA polymerase sigma-70 factor [Draconibacterium sp. IB214405]MDX8339462.1 RNA polymerase sigma-70 factor [Draconibacterium sp. IB214405]